MLDLICKELGVEVGEEWLASDGYKHKINECGTVVWYDEYKGVWKRFAPYEDLLTGKLKPIWKPKMGEKYYVPDIARDEDSRCNWHEWYNDKMDNWYLSKGLVFKTKEKAIGATNKMMETLSYLRLNKM